MGRQGVRGAEREAKPCFIKIFDQVLVVRRDRKGDAGCTDDTVGRSDIINLAPLYNAVKERMPNFRWPRVRLTRVTRAVIQHSC